MLSPRLAPAVLMLVGLLSFPALAQRQMEYLDRGVTFVAINSNDATSYPEDSFQNMKAVAAKHGFDFPYLVDETQDVARAYGAVCTPDIFGYDKDLKLVYRGRLDDAGRTPRDGNRRDLVEAMRAVATGGKAPAQQFAAIACSIKWKDA